jgi:hypothetical protein
LGLIFFAGLVLLFWSIKQLYKIYKKIVTFSK